MAQIRPVYKGNKIIAYRFRAFLGRDGSGRQITRQKTERNIPELTPRKLVKEMQSQADLWEEDLKNSHLVSENLTFGEFFQNHWWPLHVEGGDLKPSSVVFYKNMTPRVMKFFGRMRLEKICALDIEHFIKSLKDEGLSPSTQNHYLKMLRTIFDFAVRHDILIKDPSRRVKAVKTQQSKVYYLHEDDARRFLVALTLDAPLQYQALMMILLYCGLRRGEAAGLQWQDISFQNSTMSIHRNVVCIPGKGIIVGTPKTAESIRTLPLNNTVLDILKQWKTEQKNMFGNELFPTAYLFSCTADPYIPIRPDNITQWLRRFEEAHDLPFASPHDLRHTCGTLLSENGIDINTIKDYLGHSNINTTARFYVGKSTEALRKTEILERVLVGNKCSNMCSKVP